jgi:hypothetical protein
MVVLFGKEFDADEGAEVGWGDGFGKLYEVWDAATKLLEYRQGLAEDGDPQGLPIVYLKDGCDSVFHRWT